MKTKEAPAVPSHVAEGPAEVRHKDGWLVCDVPADSYARLIAAAPELLEALHLVSKSLGWQDMPMETRAVVEAAIAKAEG